MPVSLENIREQLLPGVWEMTASRAVSDRWDGVFQTDMWSSFPGSLVVPEPLSAAVPLVAAAVIAKNPEVTRRGLVGWMQRLLC
jgi:hypothetical protein